VLADGTLPQLVSDYVARACRGGRPRPGQIQLTQEGSMWSKPGAPERRFTAIQYSAVDHVAFEWRARFPFARLLSLEVVDAYYGGEGSLEVRLFGRRFQNERGPETTAGEAMRYLAELPWAPHAMYANRQLRWTAVGETHVEVHLEPDPALRVAFEFDAGGEIVRVSSTTRSLKREGRWMPTPWTGEFADYRDIGGMRMPTSADVSWDLPEGRFRYWHGRIVAARALPSPFSSSRDRSAIEGVG
jgi:hypothetical protein